MANKTILDKLNELQDAKEDIQAAIREKGGVVSDDTLAGLADDIRDIPQDGYAWASIGWSKAPDEWADMVADARAYKEAWEAMEIKPALKDYFKNNEEIVLLPMMAGFNTTDDLSQAFYNCKQLRWLPEGMTFADTTTATGLFQNCENLRALPTGCTLSKVNNGNDIFNGCKQLKELVLDFPTPHDGYQLFRNCSKLQRLVVNMAGHRGSVLSMWSGCTSLTYCRLNGFGNGYAANASVSASMADCPLDLAGVTALFDSLGDRSSATATSTIQLSTYTKNLLTAEVTAMATEKNWTIA